MNQISEIDNDLRHEYDFTQLTVVACGKGCKKSNLTIELDPDVATIFPFCYGDAFIPSSCISPV
jgi:hypothetical protein